MFSMDFITEVSAVKDLSAAKAKVQQHIDASQANDANKRTATTMVYNSHTVKNLLLGMSNFTLSHMGMKSIR
jgi:hypothetical protein